MRAHGEAQLYPNLSAPWPFLVSGFLPGTPWSQHCSSVFSFIVLASSSPSHSYLETAALQSLGADSASKLLLESKLLLTSQPAVNGNARFLFWE